MVQSTKQTHIPQQQQIRLGDLLKKEGIITDEQLTTVIKQQEISGGKLGKILVELGFIEEENLLRILARNLGIPFIDLKHYALNPSTMRELSETHSRRFGAIILDDSDEGLLVGMVDPQDIVAYDELSRILKRPLHLALVREQDLLQTIDLVYRHTDEISTFAEELSEEMSGHDFDISQLDVGLDVSDIPVVKLLQSIFEDAVQVGASDIHIEPDESVLRIRQRIDGVLHEHVMKEKRIAQALTLRLKLMSGLNIAERRLPQDGRFSIKIKGKNFDIRLSTMPVQFGESVVMRLLNQSATALKLANIGMPDDMLQRLRKIIQLPHGMMLVTGPTGSGKTTTLYGVLSELNDAASKIITVEDPVEYRLPRISQVQVKPKIELTFARVLRAILRQDPDIIMVGELRDQETVEIALRASMTGHFVLSTLHTNDAISSTVRLLDMGAQGYLVASVLKAVISQRLVRRVCRSCVADYQAEEDEIAWVKSVIGEEAVKWPLKQGTGCSHCGGTGFKGQIGVFELLEFNASLIDALRNNDTETFIKEANHAPGFSPLAFTAMNIARSGETTLSEVIRIAADVGTA